jgi:hypothetical protein
MLGEGINTLRFQDTFNEFVGFSFDTFPLIFGNAPFQSLLGIRSPCPSAWGHLISPANLLTRL